MVAVPSSEKDDLRRVLDDDGKPLPGARVPSIPDATLTRMFEVMLLTRMVDERMMRLSRQGRLGFYVSSLGEEASQIAAAAAPRASDWVFPSYRDQGVWLWRGYTLQQYVDQLFGNADDPAKGRQMPVHHAASWLHLVSVSSPVGTQIPQAVGAAYAARMLDKADVTMAMFGEGATSTGEFHVGMNFAAVWKAPCVFVCRNTVQLRAGGRPINVPSSIQTASRTLAVKAIGYGMPGVRVDGNDALAVWQVASEAIERARAGDGPTLIEVLTYGIDGQSSSDAPSVHRDAAEPEVPEVLGERRDPIRRLRGFLGHRGLWSERWEAELAERHEREISDALAAAEHKPPPAIDSLFDDVYEQLPWHLREQRAYLAALPRPTNPHHG